MSDHPKTKRIAIITASPPGENGVGQNYMRDLVETIKDHEVHVFAVLKEDSEWRAEERTFVSGQTRLARRYEYPCGIGPFPFKSWSATAAFHLMTVRHARRLSKVIIESIRSNRYDSVLVVLESPLLMLIGESLCRRLSCPVQVLVWDHPDHVCSAFGHNGARKRRLLVAFSQAVSHASAALTVAASLKELLAEVNANLPIRLFRSPARADAKTIASERLKESSPFVIGFAGSVTAPDELELLQRSLDQLKWKINERPVVLRLFGKRFTLSASVRRNLQYHGFLPTQADVIKELSDCDICFLPQPFSSSLRKVAEYSFPTKLSSYLSSGRPVLVLAPPHASLSHFTCDQTFDIEAESCYGFLCVSDDLGMLANLIRRLVNDDVFYQRGCSRAKTCASRFFRMDTGASNVRAALGIAKVAAE